MTNKSKAYHKLFELYNQRDLLIFLQGAEWFNNQAIELLKETVNKDYPNKDWNAELVFWEIDNGILKLE